MNDIDQIAAKRAYNVLIAEYDALVTPRPLSEYHEDMGPVLWWCWEIPACGRCDGTGTVYDNVRAQTFACPICHGKGPDPDDGSWRGEAPYVGSPNDLGQEVLIGTRALGIKNGDTVELKPYAGNGAMRISVGGWPGYHTHWTPIPKVAAP